VVTALASKSRHNTGMSEHPRCAGRTAVALLAALAVLAAPIASRVADAGGNGATEQARQHYQKGKQLFDSGDYRGAMAEFATADQLAPSPLLEFNIALCHERLGERAEAVRRYRLYLDRVPDAQNRPHVEDKIRKLEAELKSEKAPAAGPPPPAAEAAPPAAEAAPPAAEAAPTGDPDLDRVARIDVGKVRSQREGDGGGAAAPPPPGDERGAPAAAAPPPADEGVKSERKPIYKQWWFWVVAGVSAIILVDIAISSSDDGDDTRGLMLPAPGGARDMGNQGGATIFRF
jgi:hypothetical protein